MRVGRDSAKIAAAALGIGLSFQGFAQEPQAGSKSEPSQPAQSNTIYLPPPELSGGVPNLGELRPPALSLPQEAPQEAPQTQPSNSQANEKSSAQPEAEVPAESQKLFTRDQVVQYVRELEGEYSRQLATFLSLGAAGTWFSLWLVRRVGSQIQRRFLKENADTEATRGALKDLEFPLRPRFSPSKAAIKAAGALMFHIERAREELYTLGRETDSTSVIHVDPKERNLFKRLIAVKNNALRESDKQFSESARPKDKLILYVVLNSFLAGTSALLRRSGIQPLNPEERDAEAPSRRRGGKQAKADTGSSENNLDSQHLRAELRDELKQSVELEIKERFALESQRLEREKQEHEKERKRLSDLQINLASQREQLERQQHALKLDFEKLGQKEVKNQRIEQQVAEKLEEIKRLQEGQEAMIARLQELEETLLTFGTEALLTDPEKALEIIYKVAAEQQSGS